MSFADFIGNAATVRPLRSSIANGRLPHGLLLSAPEGSGKYTLALMLARALNCDNQPRDADGLADFCGVCESCVHIAQSVDLDARIAEAVTGRDDMRDADKRETRILIQTDPNVLVIPPDPPQQMIKLGQVRAVINQASRMPPHGKHRVFIFSSGAFMKEAANSLLKILEEPGPKMHLILLARHTGELLPTIRSRCCIVRLGAVEDEELRTLAKARRPELSNADTDLLLRLAGGAPGRVLSADLAAWRASRADALVMLQAATEDHSALFKMTETYRAGADGQSKTVLLLRAFGALVEDVLLVKSGAPELVRNVDIRPAIERAGETLTFDWLESAVRAMDQVEGGMRRNLLRNLSLDAMAATLERQ